MLHDAPTATRPVQSRRMIMKTLLAVALALALSTIGCAPGSGVVHGADFIPVFDTPSDSGN
jgi:hypothetical protein